MNRIRIARRLKALIAAASMCLCLHAIAADTVSEQVVVSGAVKTPLTLTVEGLKAFPMQTETEVVTTRGAGDKGTTTKIRGVPLTAVLERAGLLAADHNTWKHTIVLATATDGYQVVFSWPELFNTEAGAGTLLIYERDGKPLSDREGRIALASPRDTNTGPRSVRWLARLVVRVVKE